MSDWIVSLEGTEAGHQLALGLALLAALLHAMFGALQKGRHDPWLTRGAIDGCYALMAAPFLFVDSFFTRGDFTSDDARRTAEALFHFGWGVPAFVLIKVLAPGFFAREDTKTPMNFSLISVAVNTIVGASLFFFL